MTQADRPPANSKKVRVAIIGTLVVAVGLLLFGAVTIYTDRPAFCAGCHEMKPYYDEWAAGKHRDVWCVDCHVGRALPLRAYHKFLAFKEIYAHFAGETTFPRPEEPRLPKGACSSCHRDVQAKMRKYNHAFHAAKAACQDCHSEVGHSVNSAVLQAAGVLDPNVVRLPYSTPVASIGQGSANIVGHLVVPCTQCHDMTETGCKSCHKPKHKPRGSCDLCHEPGRRWVFTHPKDRECDVCHDAPTKHLKLIRRDLDPCADCHHDPGKAWSFRHPSAPASCSPCHTQPSGHYKPEGKTLPECSLCHRHPGRDWRPQHPLQSANCNLCHTPPAKHRSGTCSRCHRAATSFAFVHPRTGAGHSISQLKCTVCHLPGAQKPDCTCHSKGNAPGKNGRPIGDLD
jgi:nitrate/TMAO reductase-like tetraheme cytochrome c subunit